MRKNPFFFLSNIFVFCLVPYQPPIITTTTTAHFTAISGSTYVPQPWKYVNFLVLKVTWICIYKQTDKLYNQMQEKKGFTFFFFFFLLFLDHDFYIKLVFFFFVLHEIKKKLQNFYFVVVFSCIFSFTLSLYAVVYSLISYVLRRAKKKKTQKKKQNFVLRKRTYNPFRVGFHLKEEKNLRREKIFITEKNKKKKVNSSDSLKKKSENLEKKTTFLYALIS